MSKAWRSRAQSRYSIVLPSESLLDDTTYAAAAKRIEDIPIVQLQDAFRRKKKKQPRQPGGGRKHPRPARSSSGGGGGGDHAESSSSGDDDRFVSLELEPFLDAFRDVFRVSDHELKLMFMRVDANGNGSVDWDELASFLLVNAKAVAGNEKEEVTRVVSDDYVQAHQPRPAQKTALKWFEHTDCVNRIVVHPRYTPL
ncbi:hypothetical protein DIPPA_16815 [Diplonema papillatum]|nr:hypothetical protein DIPPA_16815 [Diplonema papillatum]